VVVSETDFMGTALDPPEDNSPLVVDPNAVESAKIAPESLKPIARWGA